MKVFTIVVAYHPQEERLLRLCATLSGSGSQVIVVDNTESAGRRDEVPIGAGLRIRLGDNHGIARAQNIGISRALELGADLVVLFDQDSEPDATFMGRMLRHVTPGVAGVWAPVCRDRTTNEELPSFRLNGLRLASKVFSTGRSAPYAVDLVIASGVVATASTFSVAGLMDEDFFIDFVDFEWCLRCRGRGVPVRVVPDAVLPHSIGERTIDMGVMRGPVHGVARSYYKIRNCFLLFRKPDVPVPYAVSSMISGVVRYVLMLPFLKDRVAYTGAFFRAIGHGLVGVVGRDPAMAGPGSFPGRIAR
jgi:rhamnosyltransferase